MKRAIHAWRVPGKVVSAATMAMLARCLTTATARTTVWVVRGSAMTTTFAQPTHAITTLAARHATCKAQAVTTATNALKLIGALPVVVLAPTSPMARRVMTASFVLMTTYANSVFAAEHCAAWSHACA